MLRLYAGKSSSGFTGILDVSCYNKILHGYLNSNMLLLLLTLSAHIMWEGYSSRVCHALILEVTDI